MKILFYNHTGKIGGAERVLLTIVRNLDRIRFEPIVICPDGALREQMEASSVPTEAAEVLNARFTLRPDHFIRYLKSFLSVILLLRRRVVRLDPDLIHANSVRAGLVMTVATIGLRQPVLWHVHDLLPPSHPFNPFIRMVAFASRPTRIIAVAQASADRFLHSFLSLENRVTVIRNGIDVEKFRPCATRRRAVRNQLNVRKRKVIGVIGRLTPGKGQLELIHAFAEVLRTFPNALLVIVGAPAFNQEQEYADLLERTTRDLGMDDRVRFLGEREDVASLMQAFDLFVLNSESEACSLVLLEAMAAGLPVLATSVGGTPEIITHAHNGWLVPRGNNESLVRALTTLLNIDQRRAQLGRNARETAVARFSTARFLREIDSFYSEITQSSKKKITHQVFDQKLVTD
jgi:glycosyltransferase involved in cell wall biosynthesis